MMIRRLFPSLRGTSKGQIARVFCLIVGAIAVTEFLILNIVAIYLYRVISLELSQISSTNSRASFYDKLQNNKKINKFIIDAKSDGLFVSLLQETIERLYLEHDAAEQQDSPQALQDLSGRKMKYLSFFGIDVSHSREATYIYKRILSRSAFPYHFMVVDIGANDGFISSNSFNFIQWGWDAVLVEPQPLELRISRNNIQNYVDKYNDGFQVVKYVQSVIGSIDGTVDFVITKDSQGAESHVKQPHMQVKGGDVVIQMPSMTVKTLAAENEIPKNFGILSIDAEGTGSEVLRQWISLDFRPAYIIFEHLHKQEPVTATIEYLKAHGYHYLGTLGWNLMFEHAGHDVLGPTQLDRS